MSKTERFLRVKSGAVYRYSEQLAERKDAIVVDGHTAAEYFRSIGAENDITKKYPERDVDRASTKAPSRRKTAPEPEALPVSGVIMTDEAASMDVIGELLRKDGNQDV